MRTLSLLLLAACGRVGFGAGSPDATPDTRPDARVDPCAVEATADTVALFAFDGSLTRDITMQHDATNVGATASDAAACGEGAAAFAGGGYLRVADSPAFDLPEGSIELYVRTPDSSTGALQGIVSRDAVGIDFDGHFYIALGKNGELFVRMQRTPDIQVFRCTAAAVAANVWLHVGVSFGAPGLRLWVDGVEASGTSFVYDTEESCQTPHAFGIDGNDNALVIGGLNYMAANSAPEPLVIEPLTGEVDHVRIRSTWRDFSR